MASGIVAIALDFVLDVDYLVDPIMGRYRLLETFYSSYSSALQPYAVEYHISSWYVFGNQFSTYTCC